MHSSIGCVSKIIGRDFYQRDPAVVAAELLGQRLVRVYKGARLSGIIVEAEAYYGKWDPASRAYKSLKGDLAQTLYGEVGRTLVYGVHGQWLLNVVAHSDGDGGAVLIRALEPCEGLEVMMSNIGAKNVYTLTNGPGKLTRALMIDKSFHRKPVYTVEHGLWIEEGVKVSPSRIARSKRIGVSRDLPQELRFYIIGNPFVSKKPPTK
ncbi:MAG: DNA-3-methyladenine glycosylase [Candidatus Nezhaarchaeales archaeon]